MFKQLVSVPPIFFLTLASVTTIGVQNVNGQQVVGSQPINAQENRPVAAKSGPVESPSLVKLRGTIVRSNLIGAGSVRDGGGDLRTGSVAIGAISTASMCACQGDSEKVRATFGIATSSKVMTTPYSAVRKSSPAPAPDDYKEHGCQYWEIQTDGAARFCGNFTIDEIHKTESLVPATKLPASRQLAAYGPKGLTARRVVQSMRDRGLLGDIDPESDIVVKFYRLASQE